MNAFKNEDAFLFRFFYPIGALRDDTGVALHEVDFRSEALPNTFRSCPFHDSRAGSIINAAALKTIREDWRDVISLIRFLGNQVAPNPVRISGVTDWLATFWLINSAVMMTPMFFLLQRGEGTPVPRHLASAFKIALDVPTTLDLMFLCNLPSERTCDDAAAAVFDFANEKEIFLNSGYACAGSRSMIVETLLAGTDISIPARDSSALLDDWNSFNNFLGNVLTVYVLSLWSQYLTAYGASDEVSDGPARSTVSAYDRRNAVACEAITHQGTHAVAIQATRYRQILECLGEASAFRALEQALPTFQAAFDQTTKIKVREALTQAESLASQIHRRIDQLFPKFAALRNPMRYTEAVGINNHE